MIEVHYPEEYLEKYVELENWKVIDKILHNRKNISYEEYCALPSRYAIDLEKKSRHFSQALKLMNQDSHLWKDQGVFDTTLEKIRSFVENRTSVSSITQLLPFEMMMLGDGFVMVSFAEMNAINPGLSIVCSGVNGDKIINPRGIQWGRSYQKGEKFISLAFGMGNVNFYFTMEGKYYQVSNEEADYERAINGELNEIPERKQIERNVQIAKI